MKIRGGKDLVKCPRCGSVFSISYSRTFACGSCSLAVKGCHYVKCPYCGNEFVIR
ncbi:MAG: hypothetical protein J7K82_05305 [Thermoproteales archaeon]|nr:hypothetical protein [Thermoproteales archaeon]